MGIVTQQTAFTRQHYTHTITVNKENKTKQKKEKKRKENKRSHGCKGL
jgi:hypothetical protein